MYRVQLSGAYRGLLEAPTFVVLVVLWVAGAVLEALCAEILYSLYWNGMVLERLLEANF